jgi:transcriptional regulator with XRE-family HTH domain
MADEGEIDQATTNLGQFIKQQRNIQGLTLDELGTLSRVSPSHLGRIERGERFPSAKTLRKIAKPLGFNEGELFTFAGFLSPPPKGAETHTRQIDPYVASVLALETVATQRALIGILNIIKYIAKR